ncbi:MAG: 2-succinyl-5-enolpyruvyl-6-hydroxy-3-cyclohexene-1-carboxylic-acid synthase [Flavobacteriales bacterium]
MISDKKSVQDLVHIFLEKGITDVVFSPGSRNAPLAISFYNHPDFKCYNIPDERCAAFFALGMAQQLNKPVAICCTSGTAALNYSSAICEAYYQRIPLIVLTADRPQEWINQGAGQSIKQDGIYANFIRGSYNLVQEANSENDLWFNTRLVNEAIEKTAYPVAGPVHLNLPLKENLYGLEDKNATPKVVSITSPEKKITSSQIEELVSEWNQAKKIMLLTGLSLPNQKLNTAIQEFQEKSRALVLTESTSNLHLKESITGIDRLLVTLSEDEEKEFIPDLLITYGTNIISKKIRFLFREKKPKMHWHIDNSNDLMDTFMSLTRQVISRPVDFFTVFNQHISRSESDYAAKWNQREHQLLELTEEFGMRAEMSDYSALQRVHKSIPEHYQVHTGNSASVRYLLLYARRNYDMFSNRGTSGIDGCTSTAIGSCVASEKDTLLISGDMAFLYDTNAFWHHHVPANFRVVVVNNSGGGIFRIIKGPKDTGIVEKQFEARHSVSAKGLCELHDLEYAKADSLEELGSAIEAFYAPSKKAKVLEVFTPAEVNDVELQKYFRFLNEKL